MESFASVRIRRSHFASELRRRIHSCSSCIKRNRTLFGQGIVLADTKTARALGRMSCALNAFGLFARLSPFGAPHTSKAHPRSIEPYIRRASTIHVSHPRSKRNVAASTRTSCPTSSSASKTRRSSRYASTRSTTASQPEEGPQNSASPSEPRRALLHRSGVGSCRKRIGRNLSAARSVRSERCFGGQQRAYSVRCRKWHRSLRRGKSTARGRQSTGILGFHIEEME